MAKKKNRRRRQGLLSKAINVGLVALSFARPLEILFSKVPIATKIQQILRGATFGLSEGTFALESGLAMYSPVGAAAALGFVKKYALRHFPVR